MNKTIDSWDWDDWNEFQRAHYDEYELMVSEMGMEHDEDHDSVWLELAEMVVGRS
jgi:hypothetical protein